MVEGKGEREEGGQDLAAQHKTLEFCAASRAATESSSPIVFLIWGKWMKSPSPEEMVVAPQDLVGSYPAIFGATVLWAV